MKISDFDLAKEGDYRTVTNTGNRGNPQYMAPEVRRRIICESGTKFTYSAKCDVYCLGELAMQLFQFNVFSYVSFNFHYLFFEIDLII